MVCISLKYLCSPSSCPAAVGDRKDTEHRASDICLRLALTHLQLGDPEPCKAVFSNHVVIVRIKQNDIWELCCDFQSQVLSFIIFEMKVLHEPGMFLCYSWQCHRNSSCSLSWGEMVCPQKKDWPLGTYLRTIVFSGLLSCRDLRQNSQLSKFRFAFTPCPWFEDLYGHCLNQDIFIVKKMPLLTRLGQQIKSGAPVTL